MAPQTPRENDPGKPNQSSLGPNTEKTIQKPERESGRTEKLSDALSRFLNDPNWALRPGEDRESPRPWEVELERRYNMNFMDRLRADGKDLREEIESDPAMTAILEVSRSGRARCRAERDCLYARKKIASGMTIVADFRIRLEGVKDMGFWGPTTHLYHVECFGWMVGLEKLIPENLKLEDRDWGLMVRKWYEHKGRIDLAKIGTYIKEHKAFEEEYERANPDRVPCGMQWWLLGHVDCTGGEAGCTRPPPPMPAGTPILRDYVLEGDRGCKLSAVLHNELVDELPDSLQRAGLCVARFVPEVEAQDHLLEKRSDHAEHTNGNEDVGGEERSQEDGVAEDE